jgi:hypothetical protein
MGLPGVVESPGRAIVDLLQILQIIGLLLKTFANVVFAITLAMTAGAAVYLLRQWWLQKDHSFGHGQPHKV